METRQLKLILSARARSVAYAILRKADLHAARGAARIVQQRAELLVRWYPDVSREFWISLVAMNYVQAELDCARFSVLTSGNRAPRTLRQCFRAKAGICGNHIHAFLAILSRLGVRARTIQFLNIDQYDGNMHAATEVWYKDSWHFFDVSWATFFRKSTVTDQVMSVEELRQCDNPLDHAVTNRVNAWYINYGLAEIDHFSYLSSLRVDIAHSGTGTVRTDPVSENDSSELVYSVCNLPNWVGLRRFDIEPVLSRIDWSLPGAGKIARSIYLDVQRVVGQGFLEIVGTRPLVKIPLYEIHKGMYEIDLHGISLDDDVHLQVDAMGGQSESHVAFRRIVIER
ncbi:MAG: transglutaminase domain-containing protein, partial [Planctomycetales bacterium]